MAKPAIILEAKLNDTVTLRAERNHIDLIEFSIEHDGQRSPVSDKTISALVAMASLPPR